MSHPYDMGDKKQVSILGPTLKFKGELTANEDLVIQGNIEGSIKHSSNLTIGDEGKIKADISAEHIAVEGKVDGDLDGRTSVVIKDTANVEGNIYSPTVTLHEGSTFNGKIDMSGAKKPESKTPEVSSSLDHPPVAANDANDSDDKPADDKKSGGNRNKRSAGAA